MTSFIGSIVGGSGPRARLHAGENNHKCRYPGLLVRPSIKQSLSSNTDWLPNFEIAVSLRGFCLQRNEGRADSAAGAGSYQLFPQVIEPYTRFSGQRQSLLLSEREMSANRSNRHRRG